MDFRVTTREYPTVELARAYNGPQRPCNLKDRNPGWQTNLPTCCRFHRNEARLARGVRS